MPTIEIRPFRADDAILLGKITPHYKTDYIWQMDRALEAGQITVGFHEIRLPRAISVDYPHPLETLPKQWQSATLTLVALLNNIPIGYACLRAQRSTATVSISHLAVHENARRQGIATGLIFACHDWASQKNLHRIILEMQSKNHPAIQLALKLGYEFCGFYDHYYPNHDIALFFASWLR